MCQWVKTVWEVGLAREFETCLSKKNKLQLEWDNEI